MNAVWWGLAAALAGVGIVPALTPEDIHEVGALRVPALACAAVLCVVPVSAALRAPRALFRAEYVVVMSPVYWLLLDPIQSLYPLYEIGPGHVRLAFVAILLFAAAAWAGSGLAALRGTPGWLSRVAARELHASVIFRIGIVAFALALLRFAIPSGFDPDVMLRGLMAGRGAAPWARGALGGAEAIVDHLVYFGYFLPALTVLMAQHAGWRSARTWTLVAGSFVIAAFLAQGGDRRIVGVVLGSAGLLWLLAQRRVGLKAGLVGAGFAVLVLALLNTMLTYRNVGWTGFADPLTRQVEVTSAEGMAIRVDDNFLRLAQMAAIFPDQHEYTGMRYVVWVAARPVPRVVWPGKPLDPGFSLPEFKGMSGISLSASVIGELIMAGGLIAVIMGGAIYGFLARKLTMLVEHDSGTPALLLYSVGVLALFAGMRSAIELVLMSYALFALALLVVMFERRRQPSQRAISMAGR